MQKSALSLEYVRVPVSATYQGAWLSPTADTVTMAFMQPGTRPTPSDFKAASWETDATQTPNIYYARCLVGPGGAFVDVAGTTYNIYVKVTDSPEIPVLVAGQLVST